MGKSFWAGAYVSSDSRALLAQYYPKLELDKLIVTPGFSGEEGGYAPSLGVLDKLEEQSFTVEDIWRAVVWRAAHAVHDQAMGNVRTWEDTTRFIKQNPEAVERDLAFADRRLQQQQKRLIVVFDALDRLGRGWGTIRRRSNGLLRMALAMRSYRRIRFKIFFRPDQYDDYESLFAFPDASKLRASAVQLTWDPTDLYGLLFHKLLRDPVGGDPFRELVRSTVSVALETSLPRQLRENSELQEMVFVQIAGRYMGSDRRRGRTYTWLTNHLADARNEVSPRSFLTALLAAVNHKPQPVRTAIDAAGIRYGVVRASQVRLDQLKEDYEWIGLALAALAQQKVPCPKADFIERWRSANTIAAIEADAVRDDYLPPIELETRAANRESKLLDALVRLGVIELRADERINMPDIFRVAAKLSRKGGVRPSFS